jgi:hypothetical protein
VTRVIDCDDCAHCVDLYTPELSDADTLKRAREEQASRMAEWVNSYWQDVRRAQLEQMLMSEI